MRYLVTGAGGFIGGHVVERLEGEGHEVYGVDIKPLTDWSWGGDRIMSYDLRDWEATRSVMEFVRPDRVIALASDMGGMGYIESHRLDCMLSVLINTNTLRAAQAVGTVERYFYASSACVYRVDRQDDPRGAALREEDAYPASPEDGYGWEKLFSERMARHFQEDGGLETRIGRFHNIYGTRTEWRGGREKAPAAICRKVAEAKLSGVHEIEVWGDGTQTRSFCWIDDCVEGVLRLMDSDFRAPLNIGSSELVSINQLVGYVEKIAGVELERKYVLDAPQGVRGRNSDNTLCRQTLGWEPSTYLEDGMVKLYEWVEAQCRAS